MNGLGKLSEVEGAVLLGGGVRVAAGDLDGDGRAEIITAPGFGGGPLVKVFDRRTGGLLLAYNAYDAGFVGGVDVAAGDVNGDGKMDVITGAGVAPPVKVFESPAASMWADDNRLPSVPLLMGRRDAVCHRAGPRRRRTELRRCVAAT